MNDDLISRKALKAEINANYIISDTINQAIDNTPTIDAVPVVRCKDCEYGEQADEFSYICNNGAWVHLFCRADDFCSRGVRRGKNE